MSDPFYKLYSKKHSPSREHPRPGEVTISRHDQASIYTYENTVSLPLQEVRFHLENTIRDIQTQVTQAGGLIGHIKGYAEESCRFADFSSTGDTITVHEGTIQQTRICFTAILFLMEETSVKSDIQQMFDRWAKSAF